MIIALISLITGLVVNVIMIAFIFGKHSAKITHLENEMDRRRELEDKLFEKSEESGERVAVIAEGVKNLNETMRQVLKALAAASNK